MNRWVTAFCVFAAVAVVLSLRAKPEPSNRGSAPGPQAQVIERFNLEGFDEHGDKFWELAGDVAHVNPDTDVFIEENVTLKIRGATIIHADKVYWRNSESKFLTRMPVEILHEGHRITGTGAVGRAADEYLQINRDIHMQLQGPVDVTCDGPLQIYRGEKRAVFRRNVAIRDAKGTIDAERMDVFFDADSGKATRIEAHGNVVITRGGNVSHSDTAIYDTTTQSVKLVGAPRIDVMEGDMKELDALRK